MIEKILLLSLERHLVRMYVQEETGLAAAGIRSAVSCGGYINQAVTIGLHQHDKPAHAARLSCKWVPFLNGGLK